MEGNHGRKVTIGACWWRGKVGQAPIVERRPEKLYLFFRRALLWNLIASRLVLETRLVEKGVLEFSDHAFLKVCHDSRTMI